MNEGFGLNHVVLYSKGWYETGDFWTDIRKCLECDGYAASLFTDWECCGCILAQFDMLERIPAFNGVLSFFNGIQEENCWKIGYVTKDSPFNPRKIDKSILPKYNTYEAAIRYCLSRFHILKHDQVKLTEPDFVNCLPMRKGLSEGDLNMFKK